MPTSTIAPVVRLDTVAGNPKIVEELQSRIAEGYYGTLLKEFAVAKAGGPDHAVLWL